MKNDDTLNGAAVVEPMREPAPTIAETPDAKKKAARKPKARKPAKPKAKKKAASKAKQAPKKGKKPAAKKPAKKATAKKGVAGKRGPKGNPPHKVERHGDAKYGAWVARVRKEKGLTQKALAVRMGCGQPSICNIEKGTCGASEAMRLALAKALKTPGLK